MKQYLTQCVTVIFLLLAVIYALSVATVVYRAGVSTHSTSTP